MNTALCLGGAASVQEDWTAALPLGEYDFVVACNDVGEIWPGRLDVWVTLHPEKLGGWRDQRRANGYPEAARYLVHGDYVPEWAELVEFRFPGQGDSGSSGLFAAKAALIDLGADRVVLAGIQLSRASHFYDAAQWEAAGGYRTVWEGLRPEYRVRIRSMSGWTAHFFGLPTTEWLATGSTDADVPAPTLESTRMSKIVLDKIAYEPHPVSLERKRELNAKGYKIVDARFAPADVKPIEQTLRNDGPTVEQYVAAGYLAKNYPPDGYASRSTPAEIAAAIAAQEMPTGVGTDSGDQFTDEQLRAAIETATGQKPHHLLGRAKLVEKFNALNAELGAD